MVRRALTEVIAFAKQRAMFGQRLADFLLTQTTRDDIAALVVAAALLTYRTAWLREDGERVSLATSATQRQAVTVAAAMVKMTATGNAQREVYMALQLHGGLGVKAGTKVESLYRDVRALHI